jgi:Ni,Fe-hydrogenase I large subunit
MRPQLDADLNELWGGAETNDQWIALLQVQATRDLITATTGGRAPHHTVVGWLNDGMAADLKAVARGMDKNTAQRVHDLLHTREDIVVEPVIEEGLQLIAAVEAENGPDDSIEAMRAWIEHLAVGR